MPYDIVDHPGQIELYNMMQLFFTTVSTWQLIVVSLELVRDHGRLHFD